MKGLTKRQAEILDFLQQYISENRTSPSYREVMQSLGLTSLSTIHQHLQALQRKGHITIEKGCSRSVALTCQSPQRIASEVEIPLLGLVRAGFPIETFPQAQTIALPSYLVPDPANSYTLRASNDSLNEEFIIEGDLLIVEARTRPHPGEMIIALVNDHDTLLKRYHPEPPYIRLESNSPHLQPIILRPENLTLQGVIVGLLRLYH